MNNRNTNSFPARERGAAMVIALVMLLVLTLLATASARMTLMEERMTGNTQDRNIAFQAAEAGLARWRGRGPGAGTAGLRRERRGPVHVRRPGG